MEGKSVLLASSPMKSFNLVGKDYIASRVSESAPEKIFFFVFTLHSRFLQR